MVEVVLAGGDVAHCGNDVMYVAALGHHAGDPGADQLVHHRRHDCRGENETPQRVRRRAQHLEQARAADTTLQLVVDHNNIHRSCGQITHGNVTAAGVAHDDDVVFRR